MATQPETNLKIRAMSLLKRVPKCWCFKVVAGSVGGIPDIIGVCNGTFFAWELKLDGKKPTKLQEYVLYKIRQAGGIAEVVTPSNLEAKLLELNRIAFS